MTYFTSRSRIEIFQSCHKKRLLGSDFEGVGLESVKLKLQAEVGSAVHKGVEVLLKMGQLGLPLDDPQLKILCRLCDGLGVPESQGGGLCPDCDGKSLPTSMITFEGTATIDIAVNVALAQFEHAFAEHEVEATANEVTQFIYDEHAALIEGLLRMWASHPDGLPWLISEYEVLEVEKWDLKELVAPDQDCPDCARLHMPSGMQISHSKDCATCGGTGYVGGITLRSRSDALLRKRSDRGLYVWSLKTANVWDKRSGDRNKHDVQGISEVVCIEERLAQWYAQDWSMLPSWYAKAVAGNNALRIDGVQMTHFIKGKRELNEDLNVYRIKSALLHPWAIEDGFLGEHSYAHTYWYKCEAPHDTGRTTKKGPVMCEGGKNHNIGNSWKQCNVWEHMTMQAWVEKLLSGEVQPSQPLPNFFVNPMPYYRNDAEVKSWVRQVTSQERKIVAALGRLEGLEGEGREIALDEDWPMYRRSCDNDYGRPCQFVDACFGPAAIADDPVGSGLYKLRERVEHEEVEQ